MDETQDDFHANVEWVEGGCGVGRLFVAILQKELGALGGPVVDAVDVDAGCKQL